MKLDLRNLRHEKYMRFLDRRDTLITNFVTQLRTLGQEYDLDSDSTVDEIFIEARQRYEKTK